MFDLGSGGHHLSFWWPWILLEVCDGRCGLGILQEAPALPSRLERAHGCSARMGDEIWDGYGPACLSASCAVFSVVSFGRIRERLRDLRLQDSDLQQSGLRRPRAKICSGSGTRLLHTLPLVLVREFQYGMNAKENDI